MKKLLFIFTVTFLVSCQEIVKDTLIVNSVSEEAKQPRKFKYTLVTKTGLGKDIRADIIFYSNKRYNIGDTLIK